MGFRVELLPGHRSQVLCQQIAASHPGTMEAMEAMLAMGQCRTYQHRYAEARQAYQNLIDQYPGTSWASAAELYIRSLPE